MTPNILIDYDLWKMIIKLSQANIPINSYALETLKSLSPATQPRRDNVHTKLYQ